MTPTPKQQEDCRILAEFMKICWHEKIGVCEVGVMWIADTVDIPVCSCEGLIFYTNRGEHDNPNYYEPGQLMTLLRDCIVEKWWPEFEVQKGIEHYGEWSIIVEMLMPNADGDIQFIDDLVTFIRATKKNAT